MENPVKHFIKHQCSILSAWLVSPLFLGDVWSKKNCLVEVWFWNQFFVKHFFLSSNKRIYMCLKRFPQFHQTKIANTNTSLYQAFHQPFDGTFDWFSQTLTPLNFFVLTGWWWTQRSRPTFYFTVLRVQHHLPNRRITAQNLLVHPERASSAVLQGNSFARGNHHDLHPWTLQEGGSRFTAYTFEVPLHFQFAWSVSHYVRTVLDDSGSFRRGGEIRASVEKRMFARVLRSPHQREG